MSSILPSKAIVGGPAEKHPDPPVGSLTLPCDICDRPITLSPTGARCYHDHPDLIPLCNRCALEAIITQAFDQQPILITYLKD